MTGNRYTLFALDPTAPGQFELLKVGNLEGGDWADLIEEWEFVPVDQLVKEGTHESASRSGTVSANAGI